ncbi:Aerobic glycerol-3-phosphate dehydrogenase [Hyella patelloides LEGE 07179]|uniref:Aerobic glycerol-3-phosphate dehydrogenase n=1 Tax=Hyella patelloides LEGE 07179 TaxID=945734 RepID=A0A563VKE1_9CYAN|nr:glycerol-3-phosphate dehydrogenase/oxidase [Hyella patelloides]VEP11914.1 Aerobic glycerol-3-phosphate dehydrogenase [Hyella patelloides LEGE 07179]
MKRNLVQLSENVYDLVIVGGGIYGACVAWEASLRGLSVALVEKADFGSATSANSFKIIHGGLRYLQQADFKRMRESIQERTTLMRIAPHLVHPLPILVPTYGHGIKGKEALGLAMKINDLISCDRNLLNDPQKHIPRGRTISTQECQQLLPNIPHQRLTGGAIFHDAQVYNSERLTLAFIRSAEEAGAKVANYTEVIGFLQTGNCVAGVQVKDTLTGNQFEIRAKTVVNTCGPWLNRVLGLLKPQSVKIQFAKAMNLVLRRSLLENYAVGLTHRDLALRASEADRQSKSSRFLFIAPWQNKSMVGTYYTAYDGEPDAFRITNQDITNFLEQINQTYPSANLKLDDVAFVHGGLLPQTDFDAQTTEPVLSKHYQLRDYSQEGLKGLISVVGVKYTTARDVAQKTVDLIFKSWKQKTPRSISAQVPLYGGKIANFNSFLDRAINSNSSGLSKGVIRRLVYNYGSAYPNVLKYLKQDGDRAVLQAEVLYAVHEEMAQKLSDVILRRTGLGSAGYPGDRELKLCAETMGRELGWSDRKIEQELAEIERVYPNLSVVSV